nr:MAG TPA: hypothetical protein [Caudoviricetes sp.]
MGLEMDRWGQLLTNRRRLAPFLFVYPCREA